MNVAGTFTFRETREAVFAAIRDPATLMTVIPGCEAVEQVGPDAYEGRIALRLPGIAATFRTHVRLVDAVPPERAGLEGELEGPAGAISGRADFELTPDSTSTVLRYRGRAVIQGPLARLDSRFAERLAGTLIDQGLRALDDLLGRGGMHAGARHAPPESVPPDVAAERRPRAEVSG